MANRNGFTFYRSYFEAAQELSDKQRLALYDALMQYALNDTEPELSGIPKAMFILIKPTMDTSKAKSAAGTKGGKQAEIKTEANDKQTESKQEANDKQTESKQEAKVKQTESKQEANDKQNGSDIDLDLDVDLDFDSKNTPPTPPPGSESGSLIERRFNDFWTTYPKKVGKEAAKKAWNRIKPTEELFAKILKTIAREEASESWRRENGRFIPNPATWLNQGRWDDEPVKIGGGDGKYDGKNDGAVSRRQKNVGDDRTNPSPNPYAKYADYV